MSITLTYMIQDEVNFYLRDATRVWSQKRRIKEPDNHFKARNWILILLFNRYVYLDCILLYCYVITNKT